MDEVVLQLNSDSGQVEMTVAQVGLPACSPAMIMLAIAAAL
jgi:hypothetical protein